MIADACEASSRELPEPTPEKLLHLVRRRIAEIVDEGQLDESELTIGNLDAIARAMARALDLVYRARSAGSGQAPPASDRAAPSSSSARDHRAAQRAPVRPGSRAPRARPRARAARGAGPPGAALSILLTTDGRIRTLNRRWRSVDHATDVLSFPAHVPPGRGPDLGDLAISLDTARRRARGPAGAWAPRSTATSSTDCSTSSATITRGRPRRAKWPGVEDELLGRAGMVADALAPRPGAR